MFGYSDEYILKVIKEHKSIELPPERPYYPDKHFLEVLLDGNDANDEFINIMENIDSGII